MRAFSTKNEDVAETFKQNMDLKTQKNNQLFEKLEDETFDKSSSAKILSLKLLETKTPDQVLRIFESDYLR